MNERDIAKQKDVVESREPKMLLFDLETAPNVIEAWGVYEQNSLRVLRDWYILCFAWKWLGEKKTHSSKRAKDGNDRAVVEQLWDLFDEADFLVAHNGDQFDVKKARSRFLIHQMLPPKPYGTIDTKKLAKKVGGFESNKLNELGRQLGVGLKEETGGYSLWIGCMNNDPKAWEKMEKYNRQDVELLEKVYMKLRGWSKTHPNLSIITRKTLTCPVCQSKKTRKQGKRRLKTGWKQTHQCNDCGQYWCTELNKEDKIDITLI